MLNRRARTFWSGYECSGNPSAAGHEAAAAAAVLSYLFPSGATYFNDQKDEAALSRFYSGIHFMSDINVGKDHGTRIGGYTVRFAQSDGADGGVSQTHNQDRTDFIHMPRR